MNLEFEAYLRQLEKNPKAHAKIHAQIVTMLKGYGVDMTKSGETLGEAFAKGLDKAATDVKKSAKNLAEIVERYLRLRSPAKEGPLSTVDRWFKPLGPMLARQMNGAMIGRAAAGMASRAVVGAPAMAGVARGGSAGGVIENHVHVTLDGREVFRSVRREAVRYAGRN
jgi:hypothetical protein